MADRDVFAEAERLVREAQQAAERGAGPAPAPAAFPDLTALSSLVETLRGTLPPELARQLADALRELLVAVRAVLDYSIARLERPPAEPVRVEDIPVD